MEARLNRAAQLLAELRREPTFRLFALPADGVPRDVDEGYAVQEILHRILATEPGGAVVGYKVGATTKAVQEHVHVDEPCGGRIMARDVHASGAAFPAVRFRGPPVAEAEVVIGLKHALVPARAPFTVQSVADAVGWYAAGIELCELRYVGDEDADIIGIPTLVADDFWHGAAVLGERITDLKGADVARLKVNVLLDGKPAGDGVSSAALGNPLAVLTWLANCWAQRGWSLPEGHFVMTGNLAPTAYPTPGQSVRVNFDVLGSAEFSVL